MAEIENLSISINASADGACVALDRLIARLNRVSREVNSFTANSVVSSLRQVASTAGSAATALNRLATAQERVNRVMGGFSGGNYNSTMQGVQRSTDSAADSIGRFMIALSNTQSMMQRMNWGGGFGMNQPQMASIPLLEGNVPIYTEFVDDVDDGMERVQSTVQQTNEHMRSFLDTLRGIAGSGASAALHGIGIGLRGIGRGIVGIPMFFGRQFIDNIRESVRGLSSFLASIRRIAMYRLIRAALKEISKGISEGIKHLYNWSKTANGTFAASMNRIASATQYMGNSFAAMVSPLINALSPAIDFIARKFVDLFNLINQIFATLAGKSSYTAAKYVAAQWGDASNKAAGSAKKAADDIKRTLLGFDEINKLNDVNTSSGSSGSGGSGGAGAGMFETLPIEGSVSSFADQLKEAFEASNWQELGELLGSKINDIINSINWAGAGQTVGYYVNAWFSTKYWTLDTINFTNIGVKIAEFLNNMIGEIDFGILGRLLVQKMTIIGDTVIGFFTFFDWGQAAEKLSDFVQGLFDELTSWLEKYNWSNIGAVIWQNFKDTIAGIDYGDIASSIFTFLGTAIGSAAKLLAGFFGSIVADIKAWWDNDIKGEDWTETAGNLLKAIGKGFVNIGTWVFNNIIDPFMTALLGEKWDDLKDVAINIFDKIKKGWDTIVALPANVLQFFADVKNDVVQWWKNVQTWWLGKKLEVADFVTNVKNDAATWWENVKGWWSDEKDKVVEFSARVKDAASVWWSGVQSYWDDVKDKVVEFAARVKDSATTWWSGVKSYWNDVKDKVVEFAARVKDGGSTWWSGVKSYWNDVKDKVVEFAARVKDGGSTWWSGVKSYWANVKDKVVEFTARVKDGGESWWAGVKSYWKSVPDKVVQFAARVKDGGKSWWAGVKSYWKAVPDKVVEFSASIKDTAKQLWGDLKNAWDKLGAVFKIPIKLPKINFGLQDKTLDWGILGKFTVKVPKVWVSANAKGGIMDGATLFGILGNTLQVGGEAGKEALLPLDQHTEWMDNVAKHVWNYNAPETPTSNGFDVDLNELITLLRIQNNLLTQLNEKDTTVEISTSQINRAQSYANRRAGTTVVPVGT